MAQKMILIPCELESEILGGVFQNPRYFLPKPPLFSTKTPVGIQNHRFIKPSNINNTGIVSQDLTQFNINLIRKKCKISPQNPGVIYVTRPYL